MAVNENQKFEKKQMWANSLMLGHPCECRDPGE